MCWSEGGVGRDYCQLPDFRLELPSPAGEPELRLAELIICGAVKKWYPGMAPWQGGRKELRGEHLVMESF